MTQTLNAPTTARYDETATRQWFDTLHGQSAGHVWVGSTHDRFRGRAFDTRDTRWAERASAYVGQLDQTGTSGIYLRTTTLGQVPTTGRGGDDHSLTLPGLAADLDIAGPGHKTAKPLPPNPAAAKHVIDETGLLDPSVWIHSGGGLYAWWLLDQPHTIGNDLPRVKRLTARWQDVIAATSQRLGYTYGSVGDLARILRIPGTVNRKPAMPEPAACRIVHDSGRRYSLDNLRACLTDALAALPAPVPTVRRITPAATRTDGLAPGLDFEQRVDWADILERHGWTFAYEHGGTRYWCRPGKTRRDGISASTGRAGDRDRLWVFTDATVLPQGEPITKFHAYAVLECGGRHTEAARELRRQGYGTGERMAA